MAEPLEVINRRLEDYYGTEDKKASWREVSSNDQYENRYGDYEDRTPEGLLLRRYSGFRMVPKYSQWIVDKWVLEMLVVVPPGTMELTTKLSYEPAYAFPFIDGKPRIPIWDAVNYLIKGVNERVGVTQGVRYKNPDATPQDAVMNKEMRLLELEESLYGNETQVGDALAHGEGVGYTTSKELSGTIEEK